MHCDYFDAGACRSCTLMGTGYEAQLHAKQRQVAEVLAGPVPAAAWEPAFASRESGFRNKAKLVVGGRRGAPTLGILDAQGRGVDLRHCGLHEAGLAQAVPVLMGGLDLSVGAVMTLTACIASELVNGEPWQIVWGMFVTLMAGTAFGLFNGLIVVYGRLQPIIVTLATGAIAIGLALLTFSLPLIVRLIGVQVSGFAPGRAEQTRLFDDAAARDVRLRLARAEDAVKGRFGQNALRRGTSLGRPDREGT